jgi:hypothetical protein
MSSALVNRYSVYVSMPERGKVREPIARNPSLMLAVESCIAAYESTGHFSYVIEDQRPARIFALDRRVLLGLVFLRSNSRSRYFELLNQLDRSGDQHVLESAVGEHSSF